MAILRGAFEAVQRNWGALLFYIVLNAIVVAIFVAFNTFVVVPGEEEEPTNTLRLYTFLMDILLVVVAALAQTIAFSRMGRDIDRPTWRIENDREAIRRFFSLWLILNLAAVATIRILELLPPEAQITLIFMWIVASVVIIPFGGAVMFYGRVGRQEIGQALSTMGHHLPQMVLIVFVGFLFRLVVLSFQPALPGWAQPALAVVDGYTDCIMFAAMWLVCIYHRDHYEREQDDFDF